MQAGWGTRTYAEEAAPWPMEGMTREEAVEWWLEWMRLSAAPGDAVALWRMFYDSDVRDVLGTIRVPTLVLSRSGEMEQEAKAFAALIPGARQETMPGSAGTVMQEHPDAYLDAARAFARELHEEEAELESVLATVLFTDIVDSTARQAELGDRRWASSSRSTTRSSAAASRAIAAGSSTPPVTASSPRSTALCVGSAARRRSSRACAHSASRCGPAFTRASAGRSTGKVGGLAVSIGARVTSPRRPVGDPRLPDRARPRRRLGDRARRPRRARPQGRAGVVAGLRGGLSERLVSRFPRRTAPGPPPRSSGRCRGEVR